MPHGFEDSPRRRAREVTRGGVRAGRAAAPASCKAHPCHQCPDREAHARWAERWWRLKRETVGLQRKVEGRTNTVARTFDRICDALEALGYLADGGTVVTERGERLRRLYTEKDLLAAECLRHDVWKRLDAAGPGRRGVGAGARAAARGGRGLAADAERRRRRGADPDGRGCGREIEDLETEHDLPSTSMPDGGMAWMVHRWASGERLDAVLRGQDMAAGDFVRRCKQIVDLLDQVAKAATDGELRRTARTAVDAVLRGVVAADRLD